MSFFKRHKVWSGIIGIIVVLIVGFVGIIGYQAIKVRVMSVQTERHYVTYLKGVWEPATIMFMGAKDIERMKEDNMNVISLGPSSGPLSETNIIGLIKEAKNQGMAVHVCPQVVGGFGGDPDAVTEEKLAKWSEMVLHWAGKCEEYGVEYFSPLNEADFALHRDRAIAWHAEILPQIREIFSGKVIAKWSCYDDDDVKDISPVTGGQLSEAEAFVYRVTASKDFDGVMLDIPIASLEEWQLDYFWDPTKEKEPQHDWRPDSLETIILATSAEAERLGIPIYVGEFHLETAKDPTGTSGGRVIYSEEEQAETIARFIDVVSPHYDGIIHCFWSFTSGGIKGKPAEQVIKGKFGALP